jgi:hypothetical protein
MTSRTKLGSVSLTGPSVEEHERNGALLLGKESDEMDSVFSAIVVLDGCREVREAVEVLLSSSPVISYQYLKHRMESQLFRCADIPVKLRLPISLRLRKPLISNAESAILLMVFVRLRAKFGELQEFAEARQLGFRNRDVEFGRLDSCFRRNMVVLGHLADDALELINLDESDRTDQPANII